MQKRVGGFLEQGLGGTSNANSRNEESIGNDHPTTQEINMLEESNTEVLI